MILTQILRLMVKGFGTIFKSIQQGNYNLNGVLVNMFNDDTDKQTFDDITDHNETNKKHNHGRIDAF